MAELSEPEKKHSPHAQEQADPGQDNALPDTDPEGPTPHNLVILKQQGGHLVVAHHAAIAVAAVAVLINLVTHD